MQSNDDMLSKVMARVSVRLWHKAKSTIILTCRQLVGHEGKVLFDKNKTEKCQKLKLRQTVNEKKNSNSKCNNNNNNSLDNIQEFPFPFTIAAVIQTQIHTLPYTHTYALSYSKLFAFLCENFIRNCLWREKEGFYMFVRSYERL